MTAISITQNYAIVKFTYLVPTYLPTYYYSSILLRAVSNYTRQIPYFILTIILISIIELEVDPSLVF